MAYSVTVIGTHGLFGLGGAVTVDSSFGNGLSALAYLVENNAQEATITGGPFGYGLIDQATLTGSDSKLGAASIGGVLDLTNGDQASFTESVSGFISLHADLVVTSGADTVFAGTGTSAETGIFDLFSGNLGFIHTVTGASSASGAQSLSGAQSANIFNSFFMMPGSSSISGVPSIFGSSVTGGASSVVGAGVVSLPGGASVTLVGVNPSALVTSITGGG